MSHFHLTHCVPNPRLHGLLGYTEVIETIAWGLGQLGHEVTYAKNSLHPDGVNVLFGAQMLKRGEILRLPQNSILFNMEQVRNLPATSTNDWARYRDWAQRFWIWEYSAGNLPFWSELGARRVTHVPVGYAPVLTRIPKAEPQDIDVLIYGMSGEKRLQAIDRLSKSGLTTVFVSGLYGPARDQLISRSKLILNVNLYEHAQIFEIVRVSYLFANRKAVVATRDPQTMVEGDIEASVRFTTLDEVAAESFRLVEDEASRLELENRGFEVIVKRDIRDILRGALGSAVPTPSSPW